MPQSSENICPICRGKSRIPDTDAGEQGKTPFNTHFHWEYIPWPESEGGDGKLRAYLVCNACNGSGLYPDYCARVLSGEFPVPRDWLKDYAGKWQWTQDPLTGNPGSPRTHPHNEKLVASRKSDHT